jgi:transposase InsO family protein
VVPNLARGMVTTGLDQLWVADLAFIQLQEEFAFPAIVLDAFSRRVVGWAPDTHLKASHQCTEHGHRDSPPCARQAHVAACNMPVASMRRCWKHKTSSQA